MMFWGTEAKNIALKQYKESNKTEHLGVTKKKRG